MAELSPWLTIEMQGSHYLPKIDATKLGIAVFHTIRDLFINKTALPEDAEKVFQATGLKPEPAHLAGFLIQRAVTAALIQIVEEARSVHVGEIPDEKQTLAFFSREYGARIPTPLNKDFFQHPQQLPIVAEVAKPFYEWLVAASVPADEARRLTEVRFPLLFLFALNEEWHDKPDFYKPILTATDTPFQAATEREYDWIRYRYQLQIEFNAIPLFDEDFSLERVYVPLRAYQVTKEETERTAYTRDAKSIRHIMDLDTAILSWLQLKRISTPTSKEGLSPEQTPRSSRAVTSNSQPSFPRPGKPAPEQTLCVVSGGPGSGKSSCCKFLAACLSEIGRRVLYIPMHLFTIKDTIPASVGNFIEHQRLMQHNPLQNSGSNWLGASANAPLVLIFDGLDELASGGRASEEAARTFLSILKEYLRDENSSTIRVQAIISGREAVIQTHQTELTGRTVFHLLPYVLSKEEIQRPDSSSYSYSDPNALLETDQREDWWLRFTVAKGERAKGMPEPLTREDLSEITAQPLLNYLLALSYRRGTINFNIETNLNAIYADLLQAVYDKRWGGENVHAAGLTFQDFTEVLEEIGLAVWHGNGRTAGLNEIQERCKRLSPGVLTKFEEGAEKGVTRLLTAFYFRKTEAYDAPTFEFTHKSFGEYLTARRLVSSLYEIESMFPVTRNRLPEDVWERALIVWAKLFGPIPLDPALLTFIRGEIRSIYQSDAKGKVDIESFQHRLCRLIETMLADGIPVHRSNPELATFAEMDRRARNAEEALLALLNACARATGNISRVKWSDQDPQQQWTQPERAGTWLRRLCGQRTQWSVSDPLAWNCLSYLDLNSCILSNMDLSDADLSDADLHGADLREANLIRSDLRRSDLREADLREADLRAADLFDVDLRKADLSEADLRGENFFDVDLRDAVLRGADLRGAELYEANLIGADLRGARNIDSVRGFDEANLDPELHGELLEQWKKANPEEA